MVKEIRVGPSMAALGLSAGGSVDEAMEWLRKRDFPVLQSCPLRRAMHGSGWLFEGPWQEFVFGEDGLPIRFGKDPTRIDQFMFGDFEWCKETFLRTKEAGYTVVVHNLADAKLLTAKHSRRVLLELNAAAIGDGKPLDQNGLDELIEWAEHRRDHDGVPSLLLDTCHARQYCVEGKPVEWESVLDNVVLIASLALRGLLANVVHFQCTRGTNELWDLLAGRDCRALEMVRVVARNLPDEQSVLWVVNETVPLHLGKWALVRWLRALLTAHGAARFQLRACHLIAQGLAGP